MAASADLTTQRTLELYRPMPAIGPNAPSRPTTCKDCSEILICGALDDGLRATAVGLISVAAHAPIPNRWLEGGQHVSLPGAFSDVNLFGYCQRLSLDEVFPGLICWPRDCR